MLEFEKLFLLEMAENQFSKLIFFNPSNSDRYAKMSAQVIIGG